MATRRLVAFPWAGGGVSGFRAWAPHLDHDVELWAVALPGHETRLAEPPPRSMDAAVEPVVSTLAEWRVPTVLAGHSLGAWMAFEAALRLQERGAPPSGLIVSGMRPPATEGEPVEKLSARSDGELLDALDRRYGGLGPELRTSPEIVQLILPGLRADVHILESYRRGEDARVTVPIEALFGEDDRVAGSEAVVLGWSDLTHAPEAGVRRFPGGHFFVQEHPEQVARHVSTVIRGWGKAGR